MSTASWMKLQLLFIALVPALSATCPITGHGPCECRSNGFRMLVVCARICNVTFLASQLKESSPGGDTSLPWLRITDSFLPYLGAHAFSSLRIQGLQISANNVTSIADGAFEGSLGDHLRFLSVEDNRVDRVPAHALRCLHRLETLSLAGNLIAVVPRGSFSSEVLPQLKFLSLSENRIETVEKEAFGNGIAHLALSLNELTGLNGTLRHLYNLEWLLVSGNRLITLDGQLPVGPTSKLRVLSANHNHLHDIRQAFVDCCHGLRRIYLASNRLQHMDGAFDSLLQLCELNLAHNRLHGRFGEKVFGSRLPHLRILDLSRNHIESFHPNTFVNLENLVKLNLSSNELTAFPSEALSALRHLVYLDLSRNSITHLNGIKQLHLPALKYLYLAGNQLETLPSSLPHHTPSLWELDVAYNRLTSLDKHILSGSHFLRILKIKENPLQCNINLIKVLNELESNNTRIDDKPSCLNVVHPNDVINPIP